MAGISVAAAAVQTAHETGGLAPAALGASRFFQAPKPQPPKPAKPLIGDSSLRGEIDLASATRSADTYTVGLAGDRVAVLTLDPAIQSRAESVLKKSGAIESAAVVLGLDGRVLAIAGRREKPSEAADFKLALEVWAPAASIFKLATGAALLESGVRSNSRVCYHGGLRGIDASQLKDNPRLDRDCADLTFGVAKSQNAIIAKLAAKHLTRDDLAKAAVQLGFDSAADFALDVEENRFELPADKLELARVAAGFWSTELSPIGAAVLTHSIASGGVRLSPRIVSEIRGPGGVQIVLPAPGERVLPAKVAASLGKMMAKTCESGTARSAFRDPRGRRFLDGAKVAGKTGSLSIERPSYRGYSWFVGFAPADDPQVVIAVLLANPPKWRLKAHTAARQILEAVL